MRRLVGAILALTIMASSAVSAAPRNLLRSLNPSALATFRCILWAESRSTLTRLNLSDNNRYGQSGVFQIAPITWNRWAPTVGVRVPVWQASPLQQERVAIRIWHVDGFQPWHGDGCV